MGVALCFYLACCCVVWCAVGRVISSAKIESDVASSSFPTRLPSPPPHGAKNVLLLVSDDMRPQLNRAYGHTYMYTPNLDKFADTSMTFDRHYTNMAICSASRNSFMTGRRPDTVQVWNFIDSFRHSAHWDNKTDLTLPQFFKSHGYLTLGAGKLYHPNHPPNNDLPFSWSPDRPYFKPYVGGGWNTSCIPKAKVCIEPDFADESPDGTFLDNHRFADYNESVETARSIHMAADLYKRTKRPFFIGLGVTKPHADWNVPMYLYKKYMDAKPPLPANRYAPQGVPDIAFTDEFDGQRNMTLAGPDIIPDSQGPLTVDLPSPGSDVIPAWFDRVIRAGYFAAVSLADQHLGIALTALEESGVANDTVVLFTADHGYSLGENSLYAKHTNFEMATHVPLLVRVPWLPESHGKHTGQFTQLVDIYRTLASLAGLPAPHSRVQGRDISPLLAAPDHALGEEAAYSQYSRCPGARWWPAVIPHAKGWDMNNCEGVPASNITSMGYSVRVKGWRYTAWFGWNGSVCVPKWEQGPVYGRELYAHDDSTTFPANFDVENSNVVDVASNQQIADRLHAMLLNHFQKGGPQTVGCPDPHL